jgi:hypothetical protein
MGAWLRFFVGQFPLVDTRLGRAVGCSLSDPLASSSLGWPTCKPSGLDTSDCGSMENNEWSSMNCLVSRKSTKA